MPIYEYVCLGCEERFEARRGPDDAGDPTCPRCGQARARRQFSLFASTGNGGSAAVSACACGGACACGH